jgi:hypothetical protein
MFFINPFIYAGGGDYESIATVTVGSGGASSIEFDNISGAYQHLQIRLIAKSTNAASAANGLRMRLNGDTASNYATHYLLGTGSAASAGGAASQNNPEIGYIPFTSNFGYSDNILGAAIIDILDYANSSKNTTARSMFGFDFNFAGSTPGWVGHVSSLWMSTSAVTKVTLSTVSNFSQHSTAALYGVKAP